MMQFVKHFISDIILWVLLATCFFNLPYANFAENILSFYGVFLLILGSLGLFAVEKVGESLFQRKDFKPRGKLYSTYVHLTTVVEIALVASMGWWWVASGFVIYSLMIYSAREEANKIYEESK